MGDITTLLHQAKGGNAQALAGLFEALYPELRRIARQRLARDDRGTLLDTTARVRGPDKIVQARGNTVFLYDWAKKPVKLGVGCNNEVSWSGTKQ